MGFMDDGTLFDDKIASRTLPQGTDPRGVPRAADLNALKSAALALRGEVVDWTAALAGIGAPEANAARITAQESHTSGWVNVKSKGAAGDGTTDDTAALIAARTDASRAQMRATDTGQGEGGRVLLPRGVYRITDTFAITSDGVTFCGEGPGTTTLLVDVNSASKDGIYVGDGTGAGRMGKIENLSIEVAGSCRDALVVDGATYYHLENITVVGGGRYGLHWRGSFIGKVKNLRIRYAATGLKISDATNGDVPTTLTFHELYVHNATNGGALIDRGYGIVFVQPTFDSCGQTGTPDDGYGLKIGGGAAGPAEVTLIHPYFENNTGWDVVAGSDTVNAACIAILNPSFRASARKQNGYGAVQVDRVVGGGLWGGAYRSFAAPMHTVDITTNALGFALNSPVPAALPPLYNGGDVNGFKGFYQGYDSNGDAQLFGKYGLRVRGQRVETAGAAPTSGTWTRGDIVLHTTPTTAGAWGWVCVAGGTPGSWSPLTVGDTMTSDQGDQDRTLTPGNTAPVVRFGTALTGNRTVTLSTTGAWNGARFRVVRTGLGSFTLDVGGLKTIPSATAAFVDVMYDGSAWRLTGYGAL